MRKKHCILGSMATAALLFTVSCTNEGVLPDVEQPQVIGEVYGNGGKLVTMTIDAQSLTGTRADESKAQPTAGDYISNANEIDVLIFEVYERDDLQGIIDGGDNHKYKLSTDFQKNAGISVNGITPTSSQNILNLKKTNYPLTLTFSIEEGKSYMIAFWAEKSSYDDNYMQAGSLPEKVGIYTTKNGLNNLKVNYSEVKNNDELADAFCAKGEIKEGTIILHRPFAQINVGTTGADYNNMMVGDNMYPNATYQFSSIQMKGIADELNVLTGKASSSTIVDGKLIELPVNKIAAYANNVSLSSLTTNALKLKYTPEDQTYIESFLKIDLDGDDKIKDFKEYYPTITPNATGAFEYNNQKYDYLTETFKYMSMCYVLVPVENIYADYTYPGSEGTSATTLDNLNVFFYETQSNDPETAQQTGKNFIALTQVPVHSNWRTNIIGGLAYTHDPKDPNPNPGPEPGPDDPTTIFNTKTLSVYLCPFYYGESTTQNKNGTWTDLVNHKWDDPDHNQDKH